MQHYFSPNLAVFFEFFIKNLEKLVVLQRFSQIFYALAFCPVF